MQASGPHAGTVIEGPGADGRPGGWNGGVSPTPQAFTQGAWGIVSQGTRPTWIPTGADGVPLSKSLKKSSHNKKKKKSKKKNAQKHGKKKGYHTSSSSTESSSSETPLSSRYVKGRAMYHVQEALQIGAVEGRITHGFALLV
jgi:hypothetical protein